MHIHKAVFMNTVGIIEHSCRKGPHYHSPITCMGLQYTAKVGYSVWFIPGSSQACPQRKTARWNFALVLAQLVATKTINQRNSFTEAKAPNMASMDEYTDQLLVQF